MRAIENLWERWSARRNPSLQAGRDWAEKLFEQEKPEARSDEVEGFVASRAQLKALREAGLMRESLGEQELEWKGQRLLFLGFDERLAEPRRSAWGGARLAMESRIKEQERLESQAQRSSVRQQGRAP